MNGLGPVGYFLPKVLCDRWEIFPWSTFGLLRVLITLILMTYKYYDSGFNFTEPFEPDHLFDGSVSKQFSRDFLVHIHLSLIIGICNNLTGAVSLVLHPNTFHFSIFNRYLFLLPNIKAPIAIWLLLSSPSLDYTIPLWLSLRFTAISNGTFFF